MDYVPGKGRDKMYDGILAYVQSSEEKIIRQYINIPKEEGVGLKVPVSPGDISFLVEEIYRNKSIVTGIPTKLVLIRWRKPESSTLITIGNGADEQKSSNVKIHDLVCMTKEEANRHQKEILQGDKRLEDLYDQKTIELAQRKIKEAASYEQFRL